MCAEQAEQVVGTVDTSIPKELAQHAIEHTRSMFGCTTGCAIVSVDSLFAVVRVWPRVPDAYHIAETRCAGWFLHGFYIGHIYTVE